MPHDTDSTLTAPAGIRPGPHNWAVRVRFLGEALGAAHATAPVIHAVQCPLVDLEESDFRPVDIETVWDVLQNGSRLSTRARLCTRCHVQFSLRRELGERFEEWDSGGEHQQPPLPGPDVIMRDLNKVITWRGIHPATTGYTLANRVSYSQARRIAPHEALLAWWQVGGDGRGKLVSIPADGMETLPRSLPPHGYTVRRVQELNSQDPERLARDVLALRQLTPAEARQVQEAAGGQ